MLSTKKVFLDIKKLPLSGVFLGLNKTNHLLSIYKDPFEIKHFKWKSSILVFGILWLE